MSETTIAAIIAVAAVAIFLWAVSVYNNLVRLSNLKDEAWGGVDVQLKRRFDLVPNLVETVKGFAKHERETLENVIAARSAISEATTQSSRIDAENALSETLKTLFAITEAYPDLKANTNFLELQQELSSLENEIQMARRYYNGAVRDYNISIQTFPAVLISRKLGYKETAMFEADGDSREPVKVSFG
jgi:LemA protein